MLQVKDGNKKDIGRGMVRMDPADMKRLGLSDGEIIEIKGTRRTPSGSSPPITTTAGRGPCSWTT